MPYGEIQYAQCPCCGKIAYGNEEIEEKFGYRKLHNGKIIPQSYCRECRSARCEAGIPCKVSER